MFQLESRIGEWLEKSGYRKDFVAKQLDIGVRQLDKYIKGDSFPSVPRLFMLAELFRCTTDDLYRKKEPTQSE
ncbi:helix-turn-helix protein [Anoxybacillus ayderensis]|uniref:Helix-turn-helix protein n=1 Tax=Anoxybacillus ayderensis TaxID=265546 RepID=A0A0D0GZ34_9BACL|nr:helix-turn-helix transcriptional regulator [Anoxybacillus ayderensis]KIP21146.1 helix-turn-helix protein [Anoxybacillus ayderensis]